jgi:hypothetical protein
MAIFLFICPNTGYRVQGHVGLEDETAGDGTFVPVNCPVCAQVHLVDPKTTEVLAAEELRHVSGGPAQRRRS